MRRRTLLQIWLAVVVCTYAAIRLLHPGLSPAFVVLTVALATAFCLFYAGFVWSRMTRHLRRLEHAAASIPSTAAERPADVPDEFAMVFSALQRTSEHVRSIIDKAGLELARRETVLAGMAESVVAVDRDLKVTFCNEAFVEAFGVRRPVPEGRPLYEVVREPVLREILDEILQTGRAIRRRLHLPAAGGCWFEVYALPMSAGALAVLHDVTDAQRQEQARKDFVANVSHELRTPLAAIRGYAETLLDGALEDASVNRKFVEVIQSNATRLNNIASDLLALSELDGRYRPSPPVVIRISEVVESAIRTVEPAAAVGRIALRIQRSDDVMVMGNRLQLEQILINLLDNAVKFNQPGGEVVFDCTANESSVIISVADTGIGIPSDSLNRIFERFYRVDKARSRSVGGTGLGLSIVKESLERMGGSISVESQLGHGTRFTMRLPRSVSVAATPREQQIADGSTGALRPE